MEKRTVVIDKHTYVIEATTDRESIAADLPCTYRSMVERQQQAVHEVRRQHGRKLYFALEYTNGQIVLL